jgi:hypothetical protein
MVNFKSGLLGLCVTLLVFNYVGCSCSENHPKVTSTTPIANEKDVVLNRSITATFSRVLNSNSINNKTFIVKRGTIQVDGEVTYVKNTATFTPTTPLLPNTVYYAYLTTDIKSITGSHLQKNYIWSFTTGLAVDVTAPTVLTHTPLSGEISIPLNSVIVIIFNEPIKAATITPETIIVTASSGEVVTGALVSSDAKVTFTPGSVLIQNTVYTVTVNSGVTDLAGNPLAAPFGWSFTTSITPVLDTTSPTVVLNLPINGEVNVPLLSNVSVVFSEPMNPLTITSATIELTRNDVAVLCTVTYGGTTATLDPIDPLYPNAHYIVTVTTEVEDLANNTLTTAYTFSFTTLPTPDTTPPTVLSTSPADEDTNVPLNRAIAITFSEAMRTETFVPEHITVTSPGSTNVSGDLTYTNTTLTFTPTSFLDSDTTFTVVIEGVTDVVGNSIVNPYSFSFTTNAALARGPAPVLLGLAGNFAILSKAGVSAIPKTAVTGDIGTSPIDSTALTGFSLSVDASNQFSRSSQVVGKLYAADYAEPTPPYLTTAVSNMEAAYTDAAGRPIPDYTELGAGEIGSLTLDPGLYKWGTGVSIATSVTLDGGPNDVWIFQIGQGLTMAAGVRIELTGGALAKNVFWQVAGECVIATTAHFEGIALCQTAIILRTGATANGRLLAQTAVTLDQSTIVQAH